MFDKEVILIIDFGSQFTQLISRRIREQNVYSLIFSHKISLKKIKEINPAGIILSGGPMSVYSNYSPSISKDIFDLKIPVLGICYGLQLITKIFGGKIEPASIGEYGSTQLSITSKSILFKNVNPISKVWMSHSDKITKLPNKFKATSKTSNCKFSSFELDDEDRKIYGVQFHPEVMHTDEGKKIIRNFIFNICRCNGKWNISNFIDEKINQIKSEAADSNVICALSGGVDSTVAAMIVQKAIGKKLFCIHIDNGLMRKDESKKIKYTFDNDLNLNVKYVDESDLFLERLKNVTEPEKKRKIIGKTFIDVLEKEASKIPNVKYLVQGTLYPDVIESVPVKGTSSTIKTHHNVGGLPKKMNLKLIEPFRELFKDEVRKVGHKLNIPKNFLNRHPFPGPGLAVRIIGEVSKSKLDILRNADEIFIEEIKKKKLYEKIWQAFAILLPIKTVGVMGDERTYQFVAALRAVTSTDGMTADWFKFDNDFLGSVSNKIINKVKGINRVVYDISTKPPSTIEWE